MARGIGILVPSEIAERNDPHQPLVPVYDRHAPYFHYAHVARDLIEVLIFEAIQHFLAHDVAHLGRRRFAFRYCADRDVPIRNDADQSAPTRGRALHVARSGRDAAPLDRNSSASIESGATPVRAS